MLRPAYAYVHSKLSPVKQRTLQYSICTLSQGRSISSPAESVDNILIHLRYVTLAAAAYLDRDQIRSP